MAARQDDGTDYAEVGRRIKAYREALGWEQVDLAKHAGVDKGTVSRAENAKRRPSTPTLVKIAHALGKTEQVLLRGESQPPPPGAASVPHQEGDALEQLRGLAASADDVKLSRMIGELEGILYERRRRRD
jgi:transcriptional regulator with XRE-family HTH domain